MRGWVKGRIFLFLDREFSRAQEPCECQFDGCVNGGMLEGSVRSGLGDEALENWEGDGCRRPAVPVAEVPLDTTDDALNHW